MSAINKPKANTGEDEEIMKELCVSNGLTYSRLGQEGLSCVRLEMFFSGYPKMAGLSHFPNLQVLCIVGQPICRIQGLSAVPKLKELWIAECQIQKIEGLEDSKQLRRLYLYSNMIDRIENIDHLVELEKLWLNDNHIHSIEGINNLKYLRDINLAENCLEKIGNSLNGLQYLEKLELSGNKIYSFKDLTNLSRLPALTELGLKSPMYSPNPVGLLCNYTTHVLYHLPNLMRLDTYDVAGKTIKDLAEATVLKKKMYYNMRMKTSKRNMAEMKNKLWLLREDLMKVPRERLRVLFSTLKELERELLELQESEEDSDTHESGTESDKDTREQRAAQEKCALSSYYNKKRILKERIKRWNRKLAELEHYYSESVDRVKQLTDMTILRLMTELETGGNVRFEEGKPSDIWFSSCHDLILSRFCAADYRDHGITGIKIQRIMRVHNRILRSRFDDTLSTMVEDEDQYLPTNKSSAYKKLLEYLFWVWDPDLPGGLHEPSRILEEGFMDAATYKQLGKEAAVPLTNSLSIADKHRMAHYHRLSRGREYAENCPYRFGMLVVAKVYVGKSLQATDNRPIDKENYPKGVDSMFRPKKDVEKQGGKPSCECSARQCEWFSFNHELVMPEYVIEFEYLAKMKPRSPYTPFCSTLIENKYAQHTPEDANITLPTDDDILYLDPELRPRPRLIALSEELLLKTSKVSSLTNIKVLNLHGNGLVKLKNLHCLPSLRKLIVSFNELTKLDDVAQLNIEYLDASFNKISCLEGFKGMSRLQHLDLKWNKLYSTRDDVSIIRKHCPVLDTLDLRHNFWQKPEGLRLRAIGRIKSLTKLDGSSVTEIEATSALRMAAGSRISQVSLLAHSRTDTSRPRTLSLQSYAQVLLQHSRNKPDRLGDQDNQWYSKVTTLSLDSQHISKLSNLERLENLRWASFNDNDITRIEGLESCINLEEISLEHNCICRIEGLTKLNKLRRLSLGYNYISTLENTNLDRLNSLQYLAIESNKISSLLGLQRMVSLMELYAGNNQIQNIREVFYLKNLPNLVILDLYGNPVVTSADNYRLFVIYHLKSLKALDGMAIESSEGGQAKDTFGGRLTQDFVAERLGHSNFNEVRELDFPQCGIRTVDLSNGDIFLNLRSVNLEHNNMTSFSGLIYLQNLRVLCLNHNHIECIVARPKQPPPQVRGRALGQAGVLPQPAYPSPYSSESYTPILENLEVLHLGYNGIKDISGLQLGRLSGLKALFLQGNDISKIDGLEGLQDLRELVLDRNKVKSIGEYSFVNQWNLQELHLEENRVRELTNISCLENLQRLFLGMNRIQDITELDKLEPLIKLAELSVVSNAVARRMLHRPLLVYRMPNLCIIDGIPVNEDERTKAELYFMDQQSPQVTTTIETTLPGIGQYKTSIPVKVTNVQLMSGPYYDRTWGGMVHLSEEALQQEVQRGGGRRRTSSNRAGSEPLNNLAAPHGMNPQKMSGTLSYQHGTSQGPVLGSNPAARSQHNVSQVPYVPHQGDFVAHTDSMSRLNKKK